MNLKDVILGKTYRIQGNMQNGMKDGKPFIHPADYTRPIKGISAEKVFCVCGRVFLIDADLKIERVSWEDYAVNGGK